MLCRFNAYVACGPRKQAKSNTFNGRHLDRHLFRHLEEHLKLHLDLHLERHLKLHLNN